MNLKELLKEVESLQSNSDVMVSGGKSLESYRKLLAITETVEAVEKQDITEQDYRDWQKLKQVLGLK